ncbi:MAG: Maf family protein [Acidimicrobiales bacterium]
MPVPPIVLASASPRREELLGRVVDHFAVRPAAIDETPRAGEPPRDYVARMAAEKAAALDAPGSIVVAADTVVVLDGEVLGKPTDRADAAAMLRRLSGRDHEVLTAVLVADTRNGSTVADIASTVVTIEPLTEDRIAWYLDSGEADDKAGAYGLQGLAAVFADRIDGSVTNVVGLPLPMLDRLLRRVDVLVGEATP